MSLNEKLEPILMSCVDQNAHKIEITRHRNRRNFEEDVTWGDVNVVTSMQFRGEAQRVNLSAFRIRCAAPTYCCGAMMLEGMSWNFNERYLIKGTNRNDLIDRCIKATIDYFDTYHERSHFLYYVADYQDSIENALKRCGFTKISTFYNPNSHNNVHLYELKLNQDRYDDYDEDYDDGDWD